ncbi:hypothetical protein [Sporomusa silvacetica]|nr:hypothetical protein [Sporomusa silvacetica]
MKKLPIAENLDLGNTILGGVFNMDDIYDDNSKSAHGPNGLEQRHKGPYGGKEADHLSNKDAGKVFPQKKDIKARPKQ